MAESGESGEAMESANIDLAKKFGPTVRVYSYGNAMGDMDVLEVIENHRDEIEGDWVSDSDIDFSWFDLMDFAGDIDVEEEVFNDDTADAIEDDVHAILFKHGLLVTDTDGRYFFGHYLPWYVDGNKVKNHNDEWKLIQPWKGIRYSLEHINDSHPYAALKKLVCGKCEANAEFEDYSEHWSDDKNYGEYKITMKCSSCGSKATFTKETDYAMLRRNPTKTTSSAEWIPPYSSTNTECPSCGHPGDWYEGEPISLVRSGGGGYDAICTLNCSNEECDQESWEFEATVRDNFSTPDEPCEKCGSDFDGEFEPDLTSVDAHGNWLTAEGEFHCYNCDYDEDGELIQNPSGSNMPKIVGAMLGGAMLAAWFDHRAK